jgi:hypothetical protein
MGTKYEYAWQKNLPSNATNLGKIGVGHCSAFAQQLTVSGSHGSDAGLRVGREDDDLNSGIDSI